MKTYTDFDSKFRFVIVAAKRAKQLLKGAKPKLKSKSKNLIRIAQEEVMNGLVEYEIIDSAAEELQVSESNMFIGEELDIDVEEIKEEKVEVKATKEESLEKSIKDTLQKKVKKKVSEQKK